MTRAFALFTLLLLSSAAEAKPQWQPGETVRRRFALGATVGEQGFGGLVRGRWNHFAVDASAGARVFVFFRRECTLRTCIEVGPQVTLSGIYFFSEEDRFFQSGLRVGGFWTGVAGFGGMIGYVGELSLTKLLALEIGAGIVAYPEAHRRVDRFDELDLAQQIFSTVSPYVGVNVLFYLL